MEAVLCGLCRPRGLWVEGVLGKVDGGLGVGVRCGAGGRGGQERKKLVGSPGVGRSACLSVAVGCWQ